MKHIILQAIFHFLNAEFVCSINKISDPSIEQERFLDRDRRVENIKCKFRSGPKLPIICINQKCSMGVGFLHIL